MIRLSSVRQATLHYWSVSSLWRGALWALVIVGVSCSLLISTPAFASTYGNNAYGSCTYGQGDCAAASGNFDATVIVKDKDQGKASGFEVIITPIDANTTALQSAQFFIDGNLVATAQVTGDGKIHAHLNGDGLSSLTLTVVIMGQDGSQVTKHYTINLSAETIPAELTIIQRLIQGILHFVHDLPNVVKYLLPYLLFLILIIDILLLLFYTRREVEQQNKLRKLIEREHEIGELKKTFVALTSHYLRSPLAILNGGIDLMASLGKTPSDAVAKLQSVTSDLRTRIENLIKQGSAQAQTVVSLPPMPTKLPPTSTRPMLLIPVLLIGITAFMFDYLAQRAGDFDPVQIDLIIQVVIFGSLAIMLYVVVRTYQLRKQEVKATQIVLAHERDFNVQRDTFIAHASADLSATMGQLDAALLAAGSNPANKYLEQARKQLHNIAGKLAVAEQVKGSEATPGTKPTQLSVLYAGAMHGLTDKATEKNVHVTVEGDHPLKTTSPELVSYVLQTVLDNAIDYSPKDGDVTISGSEGHDAFTMGVTDHGAGVDDAKTFALFQAFSKLEGAETFNREGMGFSLYLDRLIMAYLHGSILLERIAPHGTRVVIELPSGE